jgi:hypothetical protein
VFETKRRRLSGHRHRSQRKNARGPEAGRSKERTLLWNLQNECCPADTVTLNFWPADPERLKVLFSDTQLVIILQQPQKRNKHNERTLTKELSTVYSLSILQKAP